MTNLDLFFLIPQENLEKIIVSDVPLLSSPVDRGDSRRFSTQTRRHYRQPAVAGCTFCHCLLQWLLTSTTALRGSLPADAAFTSSLLDYCNALLYDVSDGLMRRLPERRHATPITGTRCRNYISLILRQLHWLPIHHRVTFKIAVLVFQDVYSTVALVPPMSTMYVWRGIT